MEERRKHPRISSNFSLDVKPSQKGEGVTQNVSQTGLLFEHGEAVSIGMILDLTLRVPGLSGTVAVQGKVIRCDPGKSGNLFNVAVDFINIDKDAEQSIAEFLKSY